MTLPVLFETVTHLGKRFEKAFSRRDEGFCRALLF